MSTYQDLSERLISTLQLAIPPVAIRFTNRPPARIPRPKAAVPAGCAFWERGASEAVVTAASDHRFCPVGLHTHNISGAPQSQADDLRDALAAMQGLDYVRSEEVAALPVRRTSTSHVIYCPLADAAGKPEVVLLFAHASQGLVLSEALTRIDGAMPVAMGRPACALIPQVANGTRSAASMGCCGARAYLDVLSDDIALWGLHGDKIEQYVAEIETLAKANAMLTRFHERRRTDIESGECPSVAESLSRLRA